MRLKISLYLFVFCLLSSSLVVVSGKKKTFEFSPLKVFFFFFSEKTMFFRASARANDEYSHSSTASSSSAISDRSPRSECVLQREREREPSFRERENKDGRGKRREIFPPLFSLFFLFFLRIKEGHALKIHRVAQKVSRR